jgi:hypothetical protein
LAQVEKNNADGHNTLGRHLKARDLPLLVLQLLLEWFFSTIGEASFDGGPALFFFSCLLPLPVVLLLFLLMLNLHPWCLCQGALILIPMLPSGN